MKKKTLNEEIFMACKIAEVSKVPALFLGNPGVGKTTSVSYFADACGYHLEELKGNSRSAEEILGYDTVDQDNPENKSTRHLRPSWFERIIARSKGDIEGPKKTLLFLDEITTAHESVQAALLQLVFDRAVGHEKLPDDCLIISAGNYSQNLSNTMTMLPPLMNRFMILNVVPTEEDIELFLSRWSGASKHNSIDAHKEAKKELLKESLRHEERKLSEKDYMKAVELIENSVMHVVKSAHGTTNQQIDLAASDMMSLYSDENRDTGVNGFVTLRSLTYLVDIAAACFKSYGADGLKDPTFHKLCSGLVGIGLTRDKKTGDIVKNDLQSLFSKCMIDCGDSLKTLSSSAIKDYLEFFEQVESRTPTSIDGESGDLYPNDNGKARKVKFNYLSRPNLIMIKEKISQMRSDHEIRGLVRPIPEDMIKNILDNLLDTTKDVWTRGLDEAFDKKSSKKLSMAEIKRGMLIPSIDDFSGVSIDPSKVIRFVEYWRDMSEVIFEMYNLLETEQFEYQDSIKAFLKSTAENLITYEFKINYSMTCFSDYINLLKDSSKWDSTVTEKDRQDKLTELESISQTIDSGIYKSLPEELESKGILEVTGGISYEF